MKQENRIFEKFLNVLVLLGSLFIIIIVSIELLSVRPVLSEQFILNTHLIVCFIFLLDFFVRWFYSGQGWRFMWRNLFFFLVSIPYLNIVYAFAPTLSHGAWVALRLIPLARGIYGVSLIVNWMTSSKITNLFITYLTILFIIIYFFLCRTRSQSLGKRLLGCLQLGPHECHHRRLQHLRRYQTRSIFSRRPGRLRNDFLSDFYCLRDYQVPE